MAAITRFVLPICLILGVIVVLIPLPTAVMDLLLCVNIAVSVLILLTTIFVRSPLEFSVFPTILLFTTLGRLVLNVATTRLILTRAGDSGIDAAGSIIHGFGSFVTGNQVVVGLVIFSIIVLIQFLVVTKGATRMSEVAARFALDGLPGRQMAIDADVAAGVIDQTEAGHRRNELARHADFYGAMDGASKFVRGDAIAGIAITFINILGGLFIGIVQHGMGVTEAVTVFTKLTVGDGLVSQLPAFLIAVAAGMLITRSTERTNLPIEFVRQLIARPEPLIVATCFLVMLVFTRLPAIPLLMVGGSFAGIAFIMTRSPDVFDEESDEQDADREPVQPATPDVEDLLRVDPVELELGIGLLRLADAQRGGDLLQRIARLRQRVALELGMVLPRVRIRDNMQLGEYDYRFKILGDTVATNRVYPLRVLATAVGDVSQTLEGIDCEDPVSRGRAVWIDPGLSELARGYGYELKAPADVIVNHLRNSAVANAPDLLNRDAAQKLIERTRDTSPAVVEELIPGRLELGHVQHVLQRLLAESVSIRNLPVILEALCDASKATQDIDQLTESVRQRVGRAIVASYLQNGHRLNVVTLGAAWEKRIAGDNVVGLFSNADLLSHLHSDIEFGIRKLVQAGSPPVLLVRTDIRLSTRQLIQQALPNVAVLGMREIPDDIEVVSHAVVGDPSR